MNACIDLGRLAILTAVILTAPLAVVLLAPPSGAVDDASALGEKSRNPIIFRTVRANADRPA